MPENIHGDWRPPETVSRIESDWRGDKGPDGSWQDHPLGHRTPYAYPFRTCTYDGSIHPDDLLAYLTPGRGVTLNEADWKYGWPHKFYVEGIPNPMAGFTICSGGRGGPDVKDHALGDAPAFTHAKFYTEHLADATDFEGLVKALQMQLPNIHFEKDAEGKVMYRGYRGPGVR